LGNGYLQGSANLSNLITIHPTNAAIGTLIFATGMGINMYSDNILQDVKEKSLKDQR
jgi:hypothetical protein